MVARAQIHGLERDERRGRQLHGPVPSLCFRRRKLRPRAPPISSVGIPVRRRRRPGLSEQVRHPLADVVAERQEIRMLLGVERVRRELVGFRSSSSLARPSAPPAFVAVRGPSTTAGHPWLELRTLRVTWTAELLVARRARPARRAGVRSCIATNLLPREMERQTCRVPRPDTGPTSSGST